jgi:ribosomal protein L11 methyltransferase
VARALRQYLAEVRALGVLRGRAGVTVRARRGGQWAQRWKRHARPLRIGARLLIRPSWAQGHAPGGAAAIVLDPGMAFGTGGHPTTRLCLEALARHLAGGERVLDVGTGSGILAIAAAKLGAHRILALDPDPIACRVARQNVWRNGVARRVRVRARALPRGAAGRYDVTVANLTALDLLVLLPSLARCVRFGGVLLLSGILRAQEGPVRRAARAAGLVPTAARRRAGWVALEAVRPRLGARRPIADAAKRRQGRRIPPHTLAASGS